MVYIDDIIIYSNTIEEHARNLDLVFDALKKANLKVGVDKCDFFQTEINILGHHISNKTIQP